MDLNFGAFQEPRGVMRILQTFFSIIAFWTICGYSGYVEFKCNKTTPNFKYEFDYPFHLELDNQKVDPNCTAVSVIGDFSSDARFFVATGVLALLYSLGISFVYAKYEQLYKSNNNIPLFDFVLTVILAVLWLSSSAAWANGLSGLKHVTSDISIPNCSQCTILASSFSTLNISVVLGFLNFFLWASDLWFLYKETVWFQGNQAVNNTNFQSSSPDH